MNPSDLQLLCLISAATGAALTLALLMLCALIRDARAARHRRNHYIPSSTGRWRG
jgi:hypothetical protein